MMILTACQKESFQLDITANQDSSVVFVNDTKIGCTPIKTTINQGIVSVKVKKEGFEDFAFSDTISVDTIINITAMLYTKEELEIINLKKQEAKLFKTQPSGLFTDYRDNKKYKWIRVGSQIWMAENLAFKSAQCWAYDNNLKYVEDYGYLYNWKSAREACPDGWHIPSESEWKQLIDFLGGDNIASEKMRERGFSHWVDGYAYRPIATNESGFTARPGGQRNDKGEFFTLGTYGVWWSSTEANKSTTKCYWLGYMGDYLNQDTSHKNFALSVRCIKD